MKKVKVNNLKGFGFYYTQIKDVLKDYQQNKLELHFPEEISGN